MTDPQPTFTHDCEECVFLGTVTNARTILVTDEVVAALTAHVEGSASIADLNKALGVKPPEVWDLYVCTKKAALKASIIARYGNDAPEYKSSPAFYAAGPDPELSLAFKLARHRLLAEVAG